VPIDDWLACYVRDHALDTLTASERMQFRMACAQGADAVARWVDATLPKYKPLWQRLKSAQRQRRFRVNSAKGMWTRDWRAAERSFGPEIVTDLRTLRAKLEKADAHGRYETPEAVLRAALSALDERLESTEARPPRHAGPHSRDADARERNAERS
jgi:hypothetical protein